MNRDGTGGQGAHQRKPNPGDCVGPGTRIRSDHLIGPPRREGPVPWTGTRCRVAGAADGTAVELARSQLGQFGGATLMAAREAVQVD